MFACPAAQRQRGDRGEAARKLDSERHARLGEAMLDGIERRLAMRFGSTA